MHEEQLCVSIRSLQFELLKIIVMLGSTGPGKSGEITTDVHMENLEKSRNFVIFNIDPRKIK